MSNSNQENDTAESTPQEGEKQSFEVKLHKFSTVKKVIGVVSGKGGVGKSLVTALLASQMQARGLRCAILDADITGPSIPKLFGITSRMSGTQLGLNPAVSATGVQIASMNLLLENATDPVIWRGPIIANVVTQFWSEVVWKNVDYMFVDMPPGTGDVPLTVYQSLPVDGIILVTSPQDLVAMIVQKALNMARMDGLNVPVLGLVENMSYYVCPKCGEKHSIFGESHLEDIAQRFGIAATARIPIEPSIASSCDRGAVEGIHADWIAPIMDAVLALK